MSQYEATISKLLAQLKAEQAKNLKQEIKIAKLQYKVNTQQDEINDLNFQLSLCRCNDTGDMNTDSDADDDITIQNDMKTDEITIKNDNVGDDISDVE